jgi:hypothetical protein
MGPLPRRSDPDRTRTTDFMIETSDRNRGAHPVTLVKDPGQLLRRPDRPDRELVHDQQL